MKNKTKKSHPSWVRSTNETKGFERSFFQKKRPSSIHQQATTTTTIDADRWTKDLSTSSFTVAIAASNEPIVGSVSCKERSRRSTPMQMKVAMMMTRSVGTHLINSRKKISLFE